MMGGGFSGVRGAAPRDMLPATGAEKIGRTNWRTAQNAPWNALICMILLSNAMMQGFLATWPRQDFVASGPSQLGKAGFRCSRTQPPGQGIRKPALFPLHRGRSRPNEIILPSPGVGSRCNETLPCQRWKGLWVQVQRKTKPASPQVSQGQLHLRLGPPIVVMIVA